MKWLYWEDENGNYGYIKNLRQIQYSCQGDEFMISDRDEEDPLIFTVGKRDEQEDL